VRPLRGLEVARSSTLSFDALGRRPLGSLATRPGDDRFPGFDSYVSIPAAAGSNIPPTYSFSSSDPTIGDFVLPSGAGSTYPKLNVSGKPTPSFLSGLFCAFNAGTTTVTVTSGLLSSSVPVTVRPGDIGRPCGTVFRQGVGKVVFVPSTKQVRQASAPVGTSTPPPAASPAPVTAEAALPLVALPPPPAAPVAKPPAKPAPQPAPPLSLFGGLLAAAPQVASSAAVSPPPPPPTFFANPIPPGGATVRVQEEKREEEAAPESSAAFSRYSSDDHLPIQPFIFGVMLIAALAGIAIRLPRRRGPAYSMSRVRYPDRRDARPRRRYP